MANVLETSMNFLQTQDPEIAACIENEFHRQKQNIELIASENIASPAVIAAMGSVLTNKYAEGYPGKRYYGGCDYVDVLENIAMERAKALFGAAYANVQPHSGAQANLEVYAALLQPGDTLMGMDLASGGHLTHGARVNLSGKYYNSISYGVDPQTGRIDYDQVEDLVRRYHPKLLVAGASAYPRAIDFNIFADIAHRSGALLMVDMAHIAGLVAGGQHMNPVPYADVVTTTTHKTLRGPRGGMILSRDEQFAKKLNSAVFPGTQGGPLMHVIAGKAVSLPSFSIGFRAEPGEDLIHQAAVGTLAAELLLGESSALYETLYEASLIDADFSACFTQVPGAALLQAGGTGRRPDAVLAAILRGAEQALAQGFDPRRFARLQKSACGRLIRELDGSESTCYRICEAYFAGAGCFDELAALQAVTLREAESFLRRTVTPARAAISIVCPGK